MDFFLPSSKYRIRNWSSSVILSWFLPTYQLLMMDFSTVKFLFTFCMNQPLLPLTLTLTTPNCYFYASTSYLSLSFSSDRSDFYYLSHCNSFY